MSTVEDRTRGVHETSELQDRYVKARAELERRQAIETGQSGALFFAAMAYGDAMQQSDLITRATNAAKLVCIAFVFIVPNLLVLRVLF